MLGFKIQKIQLALFVRNFNPIDKISVASEIKTKMDNIFDGESTILPLPIDAPLEIPRIILKSKDGVYSCNVGIQRIDFFQDIKGNMAFEDIKGELLKKIETLVLYFIEEQKVIVGRIGFVAEFFTDNTDPISFIKSTFIKEINYFYKDEKLKNITLIFTEKDSIANKNVNRQVQLRNVSKITGGDAILLRYDLNTLSEKINEYNLTSRDIAEIVQEASSGITPQKLNGFLAEINV